MPRTVANQRIIKVHRERASSDFLGIKNSNWQAAARDLGAHALMLYMYFASNADGYSFALSPTAIRQTIGMPPQTYRDQFLKLVDKGYLVQTGGNVYEFYETPQHVTQHTPPQTDDRIDFTTDGLKTTPVVQSKPTNNIEININTINNKYQQEKQVSPAVSKFTF